MRNFTAISLRV